MGSWAGRLDRKERARHVLWVSMWNLFVRDGVQWGRGRKIDIDDAVYSWTTS